jgi:hypothetical protein
VQQIWYVKTDEIGFLLSNENTLPLPDDSRKIVSKSIMDFNISGNGVAF